MPIYEYHCQQCDAEFERLVRSPGAKVACPSCSGRQVRRKLSVFGMSSKSRAGGSEGRSSSRSSCASCRASSCAGCRK